jgi:hypothetical protein
MEKHIQITFPELKETVLIKVDDSQSPNTVKAILDASLQPDRSSSF